MCICIHCDYVDRCITYHAVEGQHLQPHLTETPNFEPVQPEINVNIRNHGTEMEWDVVGCQSFVECRNKWAKLRPGELVPT
ncbi:MAG: Ycf34 family protein [Cyanobacteria bacterium J06642_2]